MEALLSEFQKLSTSKRVIQPEQAILNLLVKLDTLLRQDMNESGYRQIEKSLSGLFKINNGDLSVQCSISIAFHLSKIYMKMQDPPIDYLISDLIKKLTQSSLIAIGEIFHRAGSKVASMLTKVVDPILANHDENLKYHALFALRGIYSTKNQQLTVYNQAVFKYLRKSVDVPPEANQIMALKLIKSILVMDNGFYSNAIECTDACLNKQQTPFVKFQASRVVAQCALIQGKNGISASFSVIKRYSNYLSPIISRFLELIPPSRISQKVNDFFINIGKISPHDVSLLAPYLSQPIKQNLFGSVLSDPKPSSSQLFLLESLITNQDDIVACAGAANHLAKSNNLRDREVAGYFFGKITKSYPKVAQHYIKSILSEITQIKSDSLVLGNSVIATAILSENPSLILPLKTNIDEYINLMIGEKEYASIRFGTFYSIMSFVPNDYLSPEKMSGPLQASISLLQNATTLDIKLEHTMDGLLRFYSAHPNFAKSDNMLQCAKKHILQLSDTSMIYFVKYVVASKTNCDSMINTFITRASAVYPGLDFIKKQIPRVITKGEDLIIPKNQEIPTAAQIATQTIINNFPEILKCCQTQKKDTIMTSLLTDSVTSQQMIVTHSMLLRIVNDDSLSANLPKSFTRLLLKKLVGSDYLRIQVTCEVVSNAIQRQPEMFDALFKFIEINKRAVSCLVLSSLMCRMHISKSHLSRALLFIDERLFSHYSAPFALLALSTALITHLDDVRELGTASQHINLILKLLHESPSLHPIVIYFLATTFIELLPIVINSQQVNQNSFIDILSIIESFRSTPHSIGKGMYYLTSSSLAKVSYQIASMIPIEFPNSEKISIPILFALAEAYALIGHEAISMTKISKLLIYINFSNNQNLISAIGQLISRQNGQSLLDLIKEVLIDEKLSAFNVPASPKAKLAVLQSLTSIFNTITINEAPIIAISLCKTASSGIVELQSLSFNMLGLLLQRFKFANLQDHFTKLVPLAFKLDFNISGGFLLSFINKENISLCFSSLTNCANDSPEYFTMATQALKICRRNSNQPEILNSAEKFAPLIQSKLYNIISTILKSPSQMGNYQSIFADLWDSYVFASFLTKKSEIDPQILLSYFIVQINHLTEAASGLSETWKLLGFLFGASAILEYFSSQITNLELVHEILLASINNMALTREISEAVSEVCKFASRIKDLSTESWDSLLYSLVNQNSAFEIETAARIFDHYPPETLEQYIINITAALLHKYQQGINSNNELKKKEDTEEDIISLFKVLIAKVSNEVNSIINEIIEWSNLTPNSSLLSFRLLAILIRKLISSQNNDDEINIDYDKISEFAVNRYRRGGCNFIGYFLSKHKNVGLQLAVRGAIKLTANLCIKDSTNAEQYLLFLLLCKKDIDNQKEFENILIQIAMKLLTLDNLSPNSIQTCVQIFKIAENEMNDEFKEFWESQSEEDRQVCMRNIMSIAS